MRSLKLSTLSLSLLCVGLALSATVPAAQAKWGSQKKKAEQEAVEKVRTYQPPPPEAITRYCEPYRAEAAQIYEKGILARFFYGPRRMWLMHEYQKCRSELMNQEYVYLKHADIEQSPSLPKLTPKTGASNGNLP